jgi:antitoxin component HigA of HigAB toxin-antitoxin module
MNERVTTACSRVGMRGCISVVLSGKRSISKKQAKRLAAVFQVTADLFI